MDLCLGPVEILISIGNNTPIRAIVIEDRCSPNLLTQSQKTRQVLKT